MLDKFKKNFKNKDGSYNKKKVFFGVLGTVVVIGTAIAAAKSDNIFPDIKDVATFANEAIVGGSKVAYETVDDLAREVASTGTEINQFDFRDIVASLPSDISADEFLDTLRELKVVVTDT